MSFSPTLGRFLETDPAKYVDGLNRYEMERSNPINRVDPLGLASLVWSGDGPTTWYDGNHFFFWASLVAKLDADEQKGGALWRFTTQWSIEREDPATKEYSGGSDLYFWGGARKPGPHGTGTSEMDVQFTTDVLLTAARKAAKERTGKDLGLGCTRGSVTATLAGQFGVENRPEGNWAKGEYGEPYAYPMTHASGGQADASSVKFQFAPSVSVTYFVKWDFFGGKKEIQVRIKSSHRIDPDLGRPHQASRWKGSQTWVPKEDWKEGEAVEYGLKKP